MKVRFETLCGCSREVTGEEAKRMILMREITVVLDPHAPAAERRFKLLHMEIQGRSYDYTLRWDEWHPLPDDAIFVFREVRE